MLRNVFTLVKAEVEDRLTDDTIFIYELVDMVSDLFLCHSDLVEMRSKEKSHERILHCFCACDMFAMQPSKRNRAHVVSAWANLDALEKQELRKVVRLSWGIRNNRLLELAGLKVPSLRTSLYTQEDGPLASDSTGVRSNSRRYKRKKESPHSARNFHLTP